MALLNRIADSATFWTLVGAAIGIGIGVTTVSAWLLAVVLAGWIATLWRRRTGNPAEGMLVASGPGLLMGWLAGFIIRGFIGL